MTLKDLILARLTMISKDDLKDLILAKAFKVGAFTLSSGQTSHFYLDMKVLTLSHHVSTIVNCLRDNLVGVKFDAVGGPSIGADPIVGAFLYSHPTKPRGFLVRKREKSHGVAGRVVGPVLPGDRCVVIEDVTTTAASTLDAVQAIRSFGASVVRAVAIVDRSEGEAEALLKAHDVPFSAILTLKDLMRVE